MELTEKEREALQMLADGDSPKHISYICGVGVTAINHRLRNVCKKLGALTLTQAAVKAIKAGIIE